MTEGNELSDRELDILRLVATGASNKEIAQKLYISSNTVKVHLRNIFAKINVASRTEAAMYAVQHGYVDTPQQSSNENGVVTDTGEMHIVGEKKSRFRPLVVWSVVVAVIFLGFVAILLVTTNQSPQMVFTRQALLTELPRWEEKSPMPTARFGFAAVTYENLIYAIGGETEDEVVGSVERYNPELDSWEILSEKPIPVSDVSGAVIGGKIYVPGGRMATGEISNKLEVYNPREDYWDVGATLPVPVSAYALAAFEGKLYLFGGWDGENYLDSVYEYDPTLDIWTSRMTMPTARGYAGAAVTGGKIYVLGGYNGEHKLSVNEVYQPEVDINGEIPWQNREPIPSGRYSMGVSVIAGIVQLFGGIAEDPYPMTLEYFPNDDSWHLIEDTPSEFGAGMGVVPLETSIYLFGGKVDKVLLNQNLEYQAMYTILLPIIK